MNEILTAPSMSSLFYPSTHMKDPQRFSIEGPHLFNTVDFMIDMKFSYILPIYGKYKNGFLSF